MNIFFYFCCVVIWFIKMENWHTERLKAMVVAPYVQKATALIGVPRKVGGNQFRHMLATFAILIDYHYTDPVLLKASLIHDLFEDFPLFNQEEVNHIDIHGPQVCNLVREVTRSSSETKSEFLERILLHGSEYAKVLKVADRISNLTDLHPEVIVPEKIRVYLEHTVQYIYPMAVSVNRNMAVEILDLAQRRQKHLGTLDLEIPVEG